MRQRSPLAWHHAKIAVHETEWRFLREITPAFRHRQPQVPILFVACGKASASRLLGAAIL
jgi:hypothetical protein